MSNMQKKDTNTVRWFAEDGDADDLKDILILLRL
jgi:hypothetical protein